MSMSGPTNIKNDTVKGLTWRRKQRQTTRYGILNLTCKPVYVEAAP